MKASLPHTLRARRRSRHGRQGGLLRTSAPAPVELELSDPAVERVRSAGGPMDHASYSCDCGMQFVAAVSTTVVCPHCRAPQAW